MPVTMVDMPGRASCAQPAFTFAQLEALTGHSSVGKKKIADQICHELTVRTTIEEQIFYLGVRAPVHDDDLMDEAVGCRAV